MAFATSVGGSGRRSVAEAVEHFVEPKLVDGRWATLVEFEWWAPKNHPDAYIMHRNAAGAAP